MTEPTEPRQPTRDELREINRITDQWIIDLGTALEALGYNVTDYMALTHAVHGICHSTGYALSPDTVERAVADGVDWWHGCAEDWVDDEFDHLVQSGALGPGVQL